MFNWLKNLFNTSEKRAITLSQLPTNALFVPPVASGVTVSDQSALAITAVFCAIRVISENVASMPLLLYRHLPGGGREEATDHPLYHLIKCSPNPESTSMTLREAGQFHLLVRGNCYMEIVRNGAGNPQALYLLDPRIVNPLRDPVTTQLYYLASGIRLSPSDLVHVPALGWNGIEGYSPITLARQSLGRMLAAENFAASLWANQAKPSGILNYPGQLSDPAKQNLSRSFADANSGAGNAGKVMVLEEGLTFQPLTFSPKDAEWLGQQQWSTEEVARIFNISPVFLHSLGRATWNNIEQLSILFVQSTLKPWLVRWEHELNRKLLTEQEQETYYFEHDITSLLRADSQARMKYYTEAIQWGILNQNEVRAKEGLNKIEGGDKYWRPLNWTDLNSTIVSNNGGVNNQNTGTPNPNSDTNA